MAKEDDDKTELEVDKLLGGDGDNELVDDQGKDNAPDPKDLRSTLKHAMKEASEKEEDDDKIRDDSNKAKKDTDKSRVQTKDKEDNDRDTSKDKKASDKDASGKEQSKLEPIGYWKAKGKAVWDKLSEEDKQHILAREKEVSDGFAQNSSKLKSYEDMERAVAPRRQMIQQFGVSEAQTVDRLFQWMENLAHPDANHRLGTLKELARSFGVDFNRLVPTRNAQDTQTNFNGEANSDPSNDPPAWFQDYARSIGQEVGTIKQSITTQQRLAADAVVNNWAKDKPHFEKVRGLMAQLTQSGAVPLKDGMIDLDGAYEMATKVHPEVAADLQREAQEKTVREAKEKSEREAKEKAERLAKAKRAGVGLKPSTPSMAVTGNQSSNKPNGSGKNTSVRDSIRAALSELRE